MRILTPDLAKCRFTSCKVRTPQARPFFPPMLHRVLLLVCAANECSSSPCMQGTCLDLVNAFACSCVYGYTGTVCQTGEDARGVHRVSGRLIWIGCSNLSVIWCGPALPDINEC